MASYPIVHVEFATEDPQAAGKFYAELFGWQLTLDEQFNYLMFQGGSGPGGAFVKVDGEQYQPGQVLVYIDCDDIEAMLRQVEARGGTIVTPKTEIPQAGWFGIFADPDGRRVGLFTSMQR